MSKKNHNRLAISLGDPAGIGMEVTLKALSSPVFNSEMKPLLIGCKKTLEATHKNLQRKGVHQLINIDSIEVEDIPLNINVTPGKPNPQTGDASFIWLTKATEFVIKGEARSLITAPIAKHAWHSANHKYAGQTERIAELANINNPSMLFTAISPHNGWRLNTLLATTHIPFKSVLSQLTPELINTKLNVLKS